MSTKESNASLADFVGNGESKWATFYLENEVFALRVEDVQEVLLQHPLTRVPLAPSHIVGLLNLRGQLMSAVDLRVRLQFPQRSPDAPYGLIVVNGSDGTLFSIVVDRIGDVLSLPSQAWRDPPDTLEVCHRGFVFGICPIDGHVVLGLKVAGLAGEVEVTRDAA